MSVLKENLSKMESVEVIYDSTILQAVAKTAP